MNVTFWLRQHSKGKQASRQAGKQASKQASTSGSFSQSLALEGLIIDAVKDDNNVGEFLRER